MLPVLAIPNLLQSPSIQSTASLLIVSFVLGLAFGAVVKHAIKLAMLLVFVMVILIGLGYVLPSQMILLINLLKPELMAVQSDLGLFLPLTASLFAIGFAIGLWKG